MQRNISASVRLSLSPEPVDWVTIPYLCDAESAVTNADGRNTMISQSSITAQLSDVQQVGLIITNTS